MSDSFGYEGMPVAITGAASGMGEATTRRLVELGADVIGIDVKPISVDGARFLEVDLADPQSISHGVSQLGPVRRLFNCAGISGLFGLDRVMRVNYLGLRFLTDAVAAGMTAGDAIVNISSSGGSAYLQHLPVVNAFVDIETYDEALQWCAAHQDDIAKIGLYNFSKESIVVYTMRSCVPLAARGIRINCIGPGPSDTPFLTDTKKHMGEDALAAVFRPLGRDATAEEQAEVLVWLNSNLASYVNGQVIWTDGGKTTAASVA